MLYKLQAIMSKFNRGKVTSVYITRKLQWKTQKHFKKISIISSFVLLLLVSVVAINYFNNAKAIWNNTITWTSKSDFDTGTTNTLVDTTSSSGDAKLINPNTIGSTISAGKLSSFVIKNDATLWATGNNGNGQLGKGDYGYTDSFMQVATDAASISSGTASSMMIKKDGTLWATGANGSGQLGFGNTTEKTSWTQTSLSDVAQVAVGDSHAVALKTDGTVWVAGSGTSGQLGFGDTASKTSWTQVTNANILKNGSNQVVSVYANSYNTYLVKSDGNVWATGGNNSGVLGLGDTTQRNTWTQLTGLSNITKIASYFSTALALKNDGTVWTVGLNTYGQLCLGNTSTTNTWAQTSIDSVVDIASGTSHSLSLKSDGSVWGCGQNTNGALGFGGPNRSNWVNTGNNAEAISASYQHSIIRKTDGTVQTTGDNTSGQLSSGDKVFYSTWQENPLTNISKVANGNVNNFVIKSDNTLWGIGGNGNNQLGIAAVGNKFSFQDTGLTNVKKVVGGITGSTALKNDGTVWTVGYGLYGTLGNGGTTSQSTWTQTLTDVKDIGMGNYSAIAIKNDGTVWSTGANGNGQLGVGSTTQKNSWTQAAGISNAVQVSVGQNHSLILTSTGEIWGAGTASYGQLGLGSSDLVQKTSFTKSTAISGVAKIWAGRTFSYAQTTDGKVWVVGYNGYGQLGLGDFNDRNSWTQLTNFTGALDIATGLWGAFIIKSDNTLYSTGTSYRGELANNIIYEKRSSFTQVATGVSAVALCDSDAIILKTNGKVSMAGDNSSGTVGVVTQNDYLQAEFLNASTNVKKAKGYYSDGVISNFKINAGNGNIYKWNSISWNNAAMPANTLIGFRSRSASTEAGLASASWSDYYTLTGSSITSANSQWLELQLDLSTSDGINTPTLNDFSVNYYTDVTAPNNPTAPASAWSTSGKTTPIANNLPKDYNQPHFEFSGATDEVNGSGIAGYYVYFGQSETADPFTAGTYQAHTNAVTNTFNSTDPQAFTPPQTITSDGIYYLRVRTIDSAGNKSSATTIFTYNFDKTAPTSPLLVTVTPFGWSSSNNFSFNWTSSFDEIGQNQSGLLGYQYKLGGTLNDWSGTIVPASDPSLGDRGGVTTTQLLTIDGIKAYQNGQNTFYIRGIDNAGNVSDTRQTYYYYNGNAPSAPQNLTVSPQSGATVNSFTFEWDSPATYNNGIKGYRYSIQAQPQNNNTTFINLSSLTPEVTVINNHVKLSNIPAATSQGINNFYVVAIDNNDQVSYGSNNIASIGFECNTPAPGVPTKVELFDTSNRDTAKYSVAVKWTEPSTETKGIGFKGYSIERSTDNWATSEIIGFSSSDSFIDTSPTMTSKPYYYRVYSEDNSGQKSNAAYADLPITPTGRYTTPPIVDPDFPVTITAKVTTAQVNWGTDRESSSFVEIGKEPIGNIECKDDYGMIQGQLTPTSNHEVAVKGLEPDTVYYYRVKFIDSDANVGCSEGLMARTQPAPRVDRVSVQDVRLYTAVLTWYTSEPAISDLLYGKTTNYSSEIKNVSGGATTVHSVRLENLDHSSTYQFAIRITDIDNNQIMSDNYSFDTLQYPKLSSIRFDPLKDQSTSTFKITWESNVPTTSAVEFKPDGGSVQENVKSKLELKHEILISGLIDNTYYLMNIVGVDQYGNQAVSDTQRIKTDYDTRPPVLLTPSTEVSSTDFGAAAKSQVVISWETDELSTSQVEYGLGVTGDSYDIKSQEDTNLTTSHIVILSGLIPSSSYHIRAVSKDASGNKGTSEAVSILTDQARSSVLDMIINSLQSSLGWLLGLNS